MIAIAELKKDLKAEEAELRRMLREESKAANDIGSLRAEIDAQREMVRGLKQIIGIFQAREK